MSPYKYIIVSLPRSQSFWLSRALRFDHDVSAKVLAGEKLERESDGLCDTGLYLLTKELQDQFIGPDTKIIRLRRNGADVVGSLLKQYPDMDINKLCRAVDVMKEKLYAFCEERDVTQGILYPIDAVQIAKLNDYFYGPEEIFSLKIDLLDNAEYKAQLKQLLHHLF